MSCPSSVDGSRAAFVPAAIANAVFDAIGVPLPVGSVHAGKVGALRGA